MARASFKASDLGEGGALYEGPVKISNARFAKTDYNGKADSKATALLFTAEHLDANDDLTEEEMIFSVGKGWEPSDDGEMPSEEGPYVVNEKEGAKINKGSAFGIFLASLEKADGSMDSADDLNGVMAEISRVAAPTTQNKSRQVYTIAEILTEVPWEVKKGPKKVASPKGKTPTEQVVDGGNVNRETLLSVLQAAMLGAGKNGLKVADLPQSIARVIATWKNPSEKKTLLSRRAEIVESLDSEFFESNEDVISYDEATGVLTAA